MLVACTGKSIDGNVIEDVEGFHTDELVNQEDENLPKVWGVLDQMLTYIRRTVSAAPGHYTLQMSKPAGQGPSVLMDLRPTAYKFQDSAIEHGVKSCFAVSRSGH